MKGLTTLPLVALIILALVAAPKCAAAALRNGEVDQYNVRLGTQTFAGLYQFTTNTLLLESAQAIREMGSDVIKLYLGNNYPRQYHYGLTPTVTNLVTLARDDVSCRQVLDMPFRSIVAWAYPFANGDAPFTDGNYTVAEQQNDYREMYALAQYLLTNYNNSGKTFYLGHWEGDGYLNVNNWSTNPSPAVIQGMIAWENVRQKAIDDAKTNLAFTNVNVFYYAEANRVRDAMLNGPDNNQRVINMVIPYVTNLDFISYSSYDAMNLDSASLYTTLDYIKSKLSSTKNVLGQRLWIGEYGWGGWSTDAQEPANRAYIQKLLPWGPRFILFWEIYNNETNRNFCLVDSNGVKAASYYLHQRFINRARLAVARFQETTGRLPSDSEFSVLMNPVLDAPIAPPVNLTLSNSASNLQGTSAVLSGQLTQGVYGDDSAGVWVYWGRRDGGTVRTNWEAGRFLGVNTNFNPSIFSTTLSELEPQTNYYYRFYATNASGEAWAPSSASFSTLTVNPADYGSRLKINFPGYHRQVGLANVPMLVKFGPDVPGFSYAQFASSKGSDLRFTDSSGTHQIPYEIDEWNPGGTSWVWVQVPQLSETNSSIWAYWGNPLETEIPSSSTNGAVWYPDAQAVWHFKEGLPYPDSAQQHPISQGSAPTPAAGMIGQGILFDGSSQHLDAGVVALGPTFTLSGWVKLDPSATGIQTICSNKKGGWNSDGFALYINTYLTSDYKLLLETGDGTSGATASTAAQAVVPGVWHHFAAVIDTAAGAARLYVDGQDKTQSSAVQAGFKESADLDVGQFTDGSFRFKGAMDELRIDRDARNSDWVWTEWMSAAQHEVLTGYTAVTLPPILLSLSGAAGFANWPATGVGFALYSASNLNAPVVWQRITNLSSFASNRWQTALPPLTGSARFFRLQAQ